MTLWSQIRTINPRVPHRKTQMYVGRTPAFTYQADKRFSYYLYVPRSLLSSEPTNSYPLAVVVHGTLREIESYRNKVVSFAEDNQCIVLFPLFPGGASSPLELDEYKVLKYGDLRYDTILIGMVEEVSKLYPLAADRFYLHGFSGGAQFAHRFQIVHPNRLAAVSIAAPGTVTLLDRDKPWWVGVRDVEEHFGRPADLAAIAEVPTLLVIGSRDTDIAEVDFVPDEPIWMDGLLETGRNRLTRVQALYESLRTDAHAEPEMCIVDGVAHDGLALLDATTSFFARTMETTKRHS